MRINPASSEVPREAFIPETYARFYSAIVTLIQGTFGTDGVGELVDKRAMISVADRLLKMLNIQDADPSVKTLIATAAADLTLDIFVRHQNGSSLEHIASTYVLCIE